MNNKNTAVLIIFIMFFCLHLSGAIVVSDGFLLLNRADIQKLKSKLDQPPFDSVYKEFLQQADKRLNDGPFSVMYKTMTPASGDKHDYYTLAPYWWKVSGKVVRKDGEVNPETLTSAYDKVSVEKFAADVKIMALAYYLSGKEIYAEKAAGLLRTWFLAPNTRMNPNLNYAQARYSDMGSKSGIIETAQLPAILDSVTMLQSYSGWTPDDMKAMKQWASDYIDWLLTSNPGMKESESENNHGMWYCEQVSGLAIFTGRINVADEWLERAKKLAISQIKDDGSQPLELARTKSFSYSMFNIQAYFTTALIAEKAGKDMWDVKSPSGRLVLAALDFILPYEIDTSKWPYKQIVPIDRKELAWLLRIAAKKYNSGIYADALKQIPLAEVRPEDYLLFP